MTTWSKRHVTSWVESPKDNSPSSHAWWIYYYICFNGTKFESNIWELYDHVPFLLALFQMRMAAKKWKRSCGGGREWVQNLMAVKKIFCRCSPRNAKRNLFSVIKEKHVIPCFLLWTFEIWTLAQLNVCAWSGSVNERFS